MNFILAERYGKKVLIVEDDKEYWALHILAYHWYFVEVLDRK